jgi:hypothetical protein
MPSLGGAETVGADMAPLKQVPPVAQLYCCDCTSAPIQPLASHPSSPNRPRTSSRLGPGFRQIRLAFSHHLRRCLAGEVGVGEAAGQAVEAQQPLDWQQHLRLAADAAGIR